jgi:uncharacterized repeat protein (TIGR01451 family)
MSSFRLALGLGLALGLLPQRSVSPSEPSADLQIMKTAEAIVYKSPAIVLYTIAVRNVGPDPASDVVVTDDLPLRPKDDILLLPDAGCSIPEGGTLMTCSLGAIDPLETKRVHVSVRYRGARGVVQNTATVSSATFDPVPDNDSWTNTIIVGPASKS